MATKGLRLALSKAQRGLPLRQAPELERAVHWTPGAELPIHRWFRYREGFSPFLFDHFDVRGPRLDPFCGCGTTLVESARRGVQAVGIDVNPLATFVAKVKSTPVSQADTRAFSVALKDSLPASRKMAAAPLPLFPLLKKLFHAESLNTLLRIRTYINSLSEGAVRDLLFLNWLQILEDCSNTFKEGNGLKYRNKRRRPGRYETIPDSQWIPAYFGDSVQSFVETQWMTSGTKMLRDLELDPLPRGAAVPSIVTGSCLDRRNLRSAEGVSLAIFSPPYANRFDYFEAFKIELWMGGFVGTAHDTRELRLASMRSNLTSRRTVSEKLWRPLEPFLEAMDDQSSSVRMGIKNSLRGYFEDTRTLLQNMHDVLAPRATVAIVVGNSAYARSIVPTDALVARIAVEEGYKVERISIARPLHVSSQQRSSLTGLESFMRESIIVLHTA